MSNFLLIDERIKSVQEIIDALNTDTQYALVDYYNDNIDDVLNKIPTQHFDVVGLITYGEIKIVDNVHINIPYNIVFSQYPVDITNLEPITDLVLPDDYDKILNYDKPDYLEYIQNETSFMNIVNFWKKVAEKCTPQHIDFLGCAILSNPSWKKALDFLEKEISVNIRSSDDNTGNLKYGGDWILESDNVNIKDLYFTKEIDKYPFLFDAERDTTFTSIYHAKMLHAEAWHGDQYFTLQNKSYASWVMFGNYYKTGHWTTAAQNAEPRIRFCIGIDYKNSPKIHVEEGFATFRGPPLWNTQNWTMIYDLTAYEAGESGAHSGNRIYQHPLIFAHDNNKKIMHIFIDMGKERSNNGWIARQNTVDNTLIKVATVHSTYIMTPISWSDWKTTHSDRGVWISPKGGITLPLIYPNHIKIGEMIRGRINLSWKPPASDGGNAISGYKIEQSIDGGIKWTTHTANTKSTNTTATITGLTNGLPYKFRVSAINSKGNGPALKTKTKDLPVEEYWDLTDEGVSSSDAETIRTSTISNDGILSKSLPTTLFSDNPKIDKQRSRNAALIDLLFKKNPIRNNFKATKTLIGLPAAHTKTDTKVYKNGTDIDVSADKDITNTRGYFTSLKNSQTVNIKPESTETQYTIRRLDAGGITRYSIAGTYSIENTSSSTFNRTTKKGYFVDGDVASINGSTVFFSKGVGDATTANEISGITAGMTYDQKKAIKSLMIGADNKLSALIPTDLFVGGTLAQKRQRRHSLLRIILETPENTTKTKIISDKLTLDLPDKFLRTDVVVIKPGQTLNTETDKGFYSPLENNDTLTIQVGDASKEYTITRTDVGGSARYTLSARATGKVSEANSTTWKTSNYFQDGDDAKIFDHAIFFGGAGDGSSDPRPGTISSEQTTIERSRTGGGNFLHPESVMNNMFFSGGYGTPWSANRKQRTLSNRDKTALNQLDISIRQSAGRPKKRQTRSLGAYQRGYMYKSQAKLEANVGSMDRMARLKAKSVANSKTHKYDE